jgi:uncharacterized protein (DUF1501 family)
MREILMSSRRDFLKASLAGSSLISLAPTVPGFLARTARAAAPVPDGRVLVVVQLDGGNDGINTLVPFADDGYARHRKTLRLREDRLIKIDDRVGLHPAMGAAAALLDSGRLALVPGVGYPNPSRSHFRSMAIWQSGELDPDEQRGPGWIGRGLDSAADRPEALFLGATTPPLALRGRRVAATAIKGPEDLTLDPRAPGHAAAGGAAAGDLAAFVRRSTLDAYATADRMARFAQGQAAEAPYPPSALAGRLRTIARLMKGGHPARVYYTAQEGFDTHAVQVPRHAALLDELSGALKAFLDDLAVAGLADRVLVLGFSEFGRRVAENGSAGTDHGTAGVALLAGSGVQPGVAGAYPSLTALDEGDLTMNVDFRRIYATVLHDWLGLSAAQALGQEHEPLPLLRERV